MRNLLLILIPLAVFGQQIVFEQQQYPFTVTFYGIEPQLGFLGANSEYHPYFGDIDNDTDFDLFIGCNMGKVYYLENIGNVNTAEYVLVTTQLVPPVIHYGDFMDILPCLVDIDNDSDYDLFLAEAEGCIWYYENIGTPDSFSFELVDTSYFSIDVPDGPVLDFIDIDNDNDYDMFIGVSWNQQNGRLYFYQNEGTPDTADMVYITDYFEEIDVGEKSSPEFIDIDNDGDYDLFVGCEDGTIWFYENIGTPDSFDFEYVTDNYFNIYTGEVSVPRFCDIDGDGDYDLFVANESAGNTDDLEGDIAFFENTGDEYNADFSFVTGNYLFMDMSQSSNPTSVDIDGDGLLELIVGINEGSLVYFDNEGSATEPMLYFADSSFLELELTYQPVMSFGDLDGDDDLDMAVSRAFFNDASIQIGINSGNSTHPYFDDWTIVFSNYDNGHGGISLCDIDGDEDLDLFFGDRLNHLYFWENTGDIYNPRFESVSDNYLNQPSQWTHLYPCFNDLDHDGDFDLVMGCYVGTAEDGNVVFWRNIGTAQNANFIVEDTLYNYPVGSYVGGNHTLVDIDGDGDDDMFLGDGAGGAMLFFRNLEYNSVNRKQNTENRSFTLFPNYPNPFNVVTTIPFTLDRHLPVKIVVYNQLGQSVVTLLDGMMDSGMHQINWDAGGVSSGVYLVRLDAGDNFSQTKKMILLK